MILSTSAAYAKHYSNEEALAALIRNATKEDPDFDVDFATRVFTKCGYRQRSVALSNPQDLFRRFTRTEYLQHRQVNLTDLAKRAGDLALQRWGGSREDITHLLWGTMTGGMHSPSLDVKLVGHLGLSRDVERTNIEGTSH